jgi:glycosyltransferase involved in cell wall biosynthesis
MSNLLVKHSRTFSPAKLLHREYGGMPIATKFRPCCEDESLNRNPLLRRKSTIERIVDVVGKAPLERRQIIVADDFSQDGTRIVLQQRERAALCSGFTAATGDIILVQDADVEYNPEDYPALLEPLMSGKADAVFGSRFMGARPRRFGKSLRGLAGFFAAWGFKIPCNNSGNLGARAVSLYNRCVMPLSRRLESVLGR